MPSPPGAYAGPKFLLSGQVATKVTETWGTEILKMTGSMDAVLATGSTSGRYTYAVGDLIKSFHNRVSYATMS